jgi:SAM-dependent methyltransferase
MSKNPTRTEDINTHDDHIKLIKKAVFEAGFLRLTFSGTVRGQKSALLKAVVRPIQIKDQKQVQFTYFEANQDNTKNFSEHESMEKLDALFLLSFSNMHLQTTSYDLHVRITKKLKVLIKKAAPSRPEQLPDLQHNRMKRHPISAGAPDSFLQGIGIMDHLGHVKPTRQDKFRQINEFLKQLHEILGLSGPSINSLNLIDCGCGNAYLTFAAYHYLSHIHDIPTQLVGIDSNPNVIENCINLRNDLGWQGLDFQVTPIADYSPPVRPDLVLSLHACDTATDDAIAQAVRWNSPSILAAPCCQHELRSQIESSDFEPVFQHGILKQRTAEILTDACRAQILRILGYRAEVVEFIDSKHTPKNLLIRAKKVPSRATRKRADEYLLLRDQWHIRPSLEKFLQKELSPFLT